MTPQDAPSTLTVESDSEECTEELGRRLGQALPAATVVGLTGELGAGKTCLVRGLAAGLDIDRREVCSPSFVYVVEYEDGRLPLVHADLYRLGGLSDDDATEAFESIGLYAALDTPGVTVVEWWDRATNVSPERLITIEFVIRKVKHRSIRLDFIGAGLEAVVASVATLRA